MKGTQPSQTLRGPTVKFRVEVGTWEKHEVCVTYGRSLRVFQIQIDGKRVYRHRGLAPWARRRATEIKTPGREVHTLIVEPPGAPANRANDPDSYWVWLDGQPILRVERQGRWDVPTVRFTGERPGRGELFAYDEARHAAAYRIASALVAGKRVLDAGCGDGLETALLAGVAGSVVGMDVSADVIAACRERWTAPNLRFEVADLARASESADRFDVILAFQILEHMTDPEGFLTALKSRLTPGGLLVLTTPNRLTSVTENPYHVHEYTADELRELLGRVFEDVAVSGIRGNARVAAFERRRARAVQRILRLDPLRLRRLLPQRVEEAAFARLALRVRRQVSAEQGIVERISAEDFFETPDEFEDAIDLLALCHGDSAVSD